ncbi:MAG: heptosyltransferase, partial [Bacteroidota bacterium]|nr:heptosyltransferase [Bacteroidota bacterium]
LLFIRQCDFFIGIDSGPRHIAHLLDLPSISLLGPGPKSFAPLNNNGKVIDKATHGCTNLACFYPKTCMEKIEVDEVYREFEYFDINKLK